MHWLGSLPSRPLSPPWKRQQGIEWRETNREAEMGWRGQRLVHLETASKRYCSEVKQLKKHLSSKYAEYNSRESIEILIEVMGIGLFPH